MQPNTYPDGFPLTPREAVEYSYFLSESEKQEWRDWINNATPEQLNELVDILHSMWQDNQKQAIPQAFSNPQTSSLNFENSIGEISPAVQNTTPVPTPTVIPTQPANEGFVFNSAPDINDILNTQNEDEKYDENFFAPKEEIEDTTKEEEVKSPEVNNFNFSPVVSEESSNTYLETPTADSQEEALLKIGNTKYTPNPVLEDKTPPREEFVYKNENADKLAQNFSDDEEDIEDEEMATPDTTADDNHTNESKEIKKSFFSSSNMRKSATRESLQEIYSQYSDLRGKNNESLQNYEAVQSQFLDKIMQVVINFEGVADYYENIIEKILEVNDRVVIQAKDIQQLKNSTQSNGGISLQEQVDELRDEMDKMSRDIRNLRTENRKRYDDMSSQLASFGADAYRQDGLIQRLDLMRSEIIQIQQQLSLSKNPLSNNSSRSLSELNPGSVSSTNNPPQQTIDLRGRV